ncbi:MAG: glycosyltransferase family 2 protein [Lachnospiraceae bacterium]|nr:glycosyltransferase family 2 protein [Lachnospiraceae bacterium]
MSYKLSIILGLDESDNNLDKIKKSIESSLAAYVEGTEVILAADIPSDAVKKLFEEYRAKYPDIIKVLYTSSRRGKGGAYNLALRNTEAEWVSFMNAGDTVSQQFIKTLLKKADESNADVIACANDSKDSDSDAEIFKQLPDMEENEKNAILIVNPGMMESKIFKREIFEKNGLWFPEKLLFEKLGIGRLALACADKFEYVGEDLYFFDKDAKANCEEEVLYDRLDVMSFFIEECFKREILEEYPEEVEAAFIDDAYLKTLFTYIAATPAAKRKKSFFEMLQNAVLDCFPEFETNPYYYEKYDDDIKDLVSLHIEAPGKFLKAVKDFDSVEIE